MSAKTTRSAGAPGPRGARLPLAILAGCVALSLLMVAPAWRGDFVFDDVPQIQANPLIQQPDRLGEALTSDVWAHRSRADEAPSNYWRPAFVLWLALQARAFGVDGSLPWHLSLAVLHGLVGFLVWRLAGRLGFGPPASALVAAAFVLHPVHVESVAWISGAPDPLMALGGLGALLGMLAWRDRGGAGRLIGAGAAYALALASKEIAIVLPALLPLLWAAAPRPAGARGRGRTWRLPVVLCAAIALAYLGARQLVLGRFQIDLVTALPAADLVASAPRVLLFYLRHALWPEPIAVHYPLRPALFAGASAVRIAAEWALLLALIGAGTVWARRDRRVAFAGALFVLPLAPALNLNAFLPEQIVHDRYLFLPVLGVVIAVVVGFGTLLERAPRPVRSRRRAVLVATSLALLAALGAQSLRSSRAWRDELALWRRAVEVDPESASNWHYLASALVDAGDLPAAQAAVARSLAIWRNVPALLVQADVALATGDLATVEASARAVLARYPDHPDATERLAMAYQRSGRLGEARDLLTRYLSLAPALRCKTLVDLAIVDYLLGDRLGAEEHLERARALTDRDRSGPCLAALYHLANLRREQGRTAESRDLARRYLERTAGAGDLTSRRLRPVARGLAGGD